MKARQTKPETRQPSKEELEEVVEIDATPSETRARRASRLRRAEAGGAG